MHELEALAIHATFLLNKEVNKVVGFNPGSLAKVNPENEGYIIKCANGEGFLKEGQVFSVDVDFSNDFQRLNHMNSPKIYSPKQQAVVPKDKKRLILNAYQANNWRSMELATLVLAYIVANSKLEVEIDRKTVAPLSPPFPLGNNYSYETFALSNSKTEDERAVGSSEDVANSDGVGSKKRKRTRISKDEVQQQKEIGYQTIKERLNRDKHVPTKVVADYLGYSLFHFHRCFLVYVGVTVQEYKNLCTKLYNKNRKVFLSIKKLIGIRSFKSIGIDSLLANSGETLKIMCSQIDAEPKECAQLFTTDCMIIPEQRSARMKKKLANPNDVGNKKHGSQDRAIRGKLIDTTISTIAPFKDPRFVFEEYERSFNDKIQYTLNRKTTPLKTPLPSPSKAPINISNTVTSKQSVKLKKTKKKRVLDEFGASFVDEPMKKKMRVNGVSSQDTANIVNEDCFYRYFEESTPCNFDSTSIDNSFDNSSEMGIHDFFDFLKNSNIPFDDTEWSSLENEDSVSLDCDQSTNETSTNILSNLDFQIFNDSQQKGNCDGHLPHEFSKEACSEFQEFVLDSPHIISNDFEPIKFTENMDVQFEVDMEIKDFSISNSEFDDCELNLDAYIESIT